MFDLGWTELLVIGVVALIVVGPKDLPVLFRRVGQFVGKAKGMAREFSQAMNDAADESGMREMSSSINKSLKTASNPLGSALDGVKEAVDPLSKLDPESETGKLAAQKKAARENAMAEAGEARTVREAATDTARPEIEAPAVPQPAVEKPAAKKPAAKKPAAEKTATKPSAQKPAAKKPAAKKPATPKPAAKEE